MSTKSQIEANIKANAAKRENEKPRVEKVKKAANPKNKRSNPRSMKRAEAKTAGKKSASRGKYGIRIQLQKNGRTPRRALDYALRSGTKPLAFLEQEHLNEQHKRAAIYQSNIRKSERDTPPLTRASLHNLPSVNLVQHASRAKVLLHDNASDSLVTGRRADYEMRWEGVGTTGTNPRIIAGTFESSDEWEDSVNEFSKLRPDIKNFVGHINISLPIKTGRISEEKWKEIIDDARHGLGLDDSFPFIAIEHRDTEADHVHLYFSRVSIDGEVHDQSNLGFRASTVSEAIEQKHNLPLYPRPDDWDIKKPTKKELEKTIRTGEPSTRMFLQKIAEVAMVDCNSMTEYLNRLLQAGVVVEITTQENDTKVSGMTLSIAGVTMKASELGKRFTAKGLAETGIIYDKNKDFKSVQLLKKQPTTQPESESNVKMYQEYENGKTPEEQRDEAIGEILTWSEFSEFDGSRFDQNVVDENMAKAKVLIAKIHTEFNLKYGLTNETADDAYFLGLSQQEYYEKWDKHPFIKYEEWLKSNSVDDGMHEEMNFENYKNAHENDFREWVNEQITTNQKNDGHAAAKPTEHAARVTGAVGASDATPSSSNGAVSSKHSITANRFGVKSSQDKTTVDAAASAELGSQGYDKYDEDRELGAFDKNYTGNSIDSNRNQSAVRNILDLANATSTTSTANGSADSTRDSSNIEASKPIKQPKKEIEKMSRFTDKVEWIQMNQEKMINWKGAEFQYGGRMNRRLKTLNIQNFEGVDFVKLDCEVAEEMLQTGMPSYEIHKAIFAKSPHEYSDVGEIREIVKELEVKLKLTKEQAEKAMASKFDQQTEMNKEIEENTNSYWKPPSLD